MIGSSIPHSDYKTSKQKFIWTDAHRRAAGQLEFAVNSPTNITLMLGQPGVGKTRLVEEVVEFVMVYQAVAFFTVPQLLDEDLIGTVRQAIMGLADTYSQKETPIFVIDDAHRLHHDTLTNLIRMSHPPDGGDPVFKLVLVAHPGFDEDMQSIAPGDTGPAFELWPLEEKDANTFVDEWLKQRGAEDIFEDEEQRKRMLERAKGVPAALIGALDWHLRKHKSAAPVADHKAAEVAPQHVQKASPSPAKPAPSEPVAPSVEKAPSKPTPPAASKTVPAQVPTEQAAKSDKPKVHSDATQAQERYPEPAAKASPPPKPTQTAAPSAASEQVTAPQATQQTGADPKPFVSTPPKPAPAQAKQTAPAQPKPAQAHPKLPTEPERNAEPAAQSAPAQAKRAEPAPVKPKPTQATQSAPVEPKPAPTPPKLPSEANRAPEPSAQSAPAPDVAPGPAAAAKPATDSEPPATAQANAKADAAPLKGVEPEGRFRLERAVKQQQAFKKSRHDVVQPAKTFWPETDFTPAAPPVEPKAEPASPAAPVVKPSPPRAPQRKVLRGLSVAALGAVIVAGALLYPRLSEIGAEAPLLLAVPSGGGEVAADAPVLPSIVDLPTEASGILRAAIDLGRNDEAAAVAAYAVAAAKGEGRAAYYLGQIYEAGEGVPRDPVMAVRWYQAASATISAAGARADALSANLAPSGGPTILAVTHAHVDPSGTGLFIWSAENAGLGAVFSVAFGDANGTVITNLESDVPVLQTDVPPEATLFRVSATEADETVQTEWMTLTRN